MATFHGKHGVVMEGSSAIAEVTKFSVKTSAKIADNTAMGSDWDTHIAGQTVNSWSGSMDCNASQADTGQAALVPGASLTLKLYPEGNTTGKNYLTGLATITDDGINADKASTVSRSFSFTGNGALSWATAT